MQSKWTYLLKYHFFVWWFQASIKSKLHCCRDHFCWATLIKKNVLLSIQHCRKGGIKKYIYALKIWSHLSVWWICYLFLEKTKLNSSISNRLTFKKNKVILMVVLQTENVGDVTLTHSLYPVVNLIKWGSESPSSAGWKSEECLDVCAEKKDFLLCI